MSGTRTRYRFGPLERRGLIAGWRGGQIASVAGGLVVAVVLLHRHPSTVSVVLALACVAGSIAFAWWPVGGRTGEQWLPTVVRWGTTTVSGTRRHRAGVESLGHCIGADGVPCMVGDPCRATGPPAAPTHSAIRPSGRAPGRRDRTARPVRHRVFDGLYLLGSDGRDGEGRMGVLHDVRSQTYTAVMSVLGHSFALLGAEEKERRVSSWAGVLGSLARERSVIHRLQWLASTFPDDGAAVDGHLSAHGVLEDTALARRSYVALLRSAGAETCRHEALLALQVRAAGATARAMRSLGGGDRAACALVAREVQSLRQQLASADVAVERVLDERALAAALRRALDARGAAGAPTVPADGALRGPAPDGATETVRRCPPCGVGWPWPLVVEEEWGMVRTDGAWHATYWIAEWPRVDVGPEFLAPLLLGSARRTVAVVMEPLSPARAVRQAERARTADIADAELRRRGGFLATARRHREAELAGRREQELADGHASFRFSGFVTVTAATVADLDALCDATEQAASQCRLELRRLYGDQARAFTCTLPLGRGLA